MKEKIIGIAGPMSLDLLKGYLPSNTELPPGYPFPMISNLIKGLISHGYHVVAYTTSKGLIEPVIIDGENVTLCIGRRTAHPGRYFFFVERGDLVNLMKKRPSDVINAQWSYEFAWAALDSGIPTVVTLQDHAFNILRYQLDPYRIVRLLMNYTVLAKSKYLIANSQYLYNLLSKRAKRKTKIIPNFYDKNLDLYFNNDYLKSNYIVSVSNGFGYRKNIKNGLKAFKAVRQKLNDIEYHLIGDGMQEGGPAFIYAKKKDLLEGVHFLGPQPFNRVKDEVSGALIFLHPSREESFGMAVLEAMVMGTAVIGGISSGNIPSLLDSGEYGLLCDVDNPDDITDKVELLLNDAALRTKLERSGRLFVRGKFNEEKIITDYINYFRVILRYNNIDTQT